MPLKVCIYQHKTLYIMTSSRRMESIWKAVMQSHGSLLQMARPVCPHTFSATAFRAQTFSAAAQSGSATQPRRQRLGQDRITSDGRLITDPQNRLDADSAQSSTDPATVGLKRPSGVPATAPATDPISNSQLAEMVDFVTGCKRLLVLTGAGCSTESNIPDYRGPKGAYSTGFQPMTHQQYTPKAKFFIDSHIFRSSWQLKRGGPDIGPEALLDGMSLLQCSPTEHTMLWLRCSAWAGRRTSSHRMWTAYTTRLPPETS